MTDITAIKKIETELLKHAATDMLTGVLNRRSGIQFLQEVLSNTKNEKIEFGICFIDLDGLKEVNDQYGHPEGDYYIKQVCQVIQEVIGPEDVLFRWGGDEFIAAFINKDESHCEAIWTEITLKLEQINQLGQKPYFLSASHGMYHHRLGNDDTLEQMINLADKAMYREKDDHQGRMLKNLCD